MEKAMATHSRLLPGKSQERRSLVGCSPWGHDKLDTTERLHFHSSLSCTGEGNGNPLQCSCLENPRDGGAWWAAIYGVTQSQKRLKQLSSSSSILVKNVQTIKKIKVVNDFIISNNTREDSTHGHHQMVNTEIRLCSQRWKGSIQSAKTRLGADCGSDHELLIAKFRLKLKKVGKTTRPFRYDLNQIPNSYTVEMRNRFKGLDLIDRVCDELWIEIHDCAEDREQDHLQEKEMQKRKTGSPRRPYK